MPPSTTIVTNQPPRPPPSSIVEPVQRSPVLSPRIVDPRQQRSSSVLPSSPPQRPPTPPQQPSEQTAENGSKEPEPIDMEIFQQILDLDEDGDTHDFAWEMAEAYFAQAGTTFEEMKDAIAKKDCKALSALGHFLKGSSATLGVTKVQDTCESIQHYGGLRDNKTGKILTPDVALSKIETALGNAEKEYAEAEVWLRKWYEKARAEGRISDPSDA